MYVPYTGSGHRVPAQRTPRATSTSRSCHQNRFPSGSLGSRAGAERRVTPRRGPRDVDFVDLRAASTVMRMQIVSTGTVLFESDRAVRQAFEVHTYSAYALLNEERAGILEDIHERGRVYGR